MDLDTAYYQGMSDYAALLGGYDYYDPSAAYTGLGAYGYGDMGLGDYGYGYDGSHYDPSSAGMGLDAYGDGSSPEELAYYQGMADYAASLSGFSSSAEEEAYYQGMQDAEQTMGYA